MIPIHTLLKFSSRLLPFGAAAIGVYLIAKAIEPTQNAMLAPAHGPITSPFGQRGTTFHNGIDIGMPIGTPIYSPADGVVSSVYTNSIGGNQLTITHANGYTTGYAHLSRFAVQNKQTVKRGQLIAYSGNTGQTTGPHLHFVVRKNNNLINPQNLFNFVTPR